MSNRSLPDAAARRAAQEVFDRPLMIEAGAGTGKTTTLVARILAWALGPGWELSVERATSTGKELDDRRLAARTLGGVAALTFTEAAAAEMSGRVAGALSAVAVGQEERLPGLLVERLPPEEVRRERARWLIEGLDQLSVQTIHAFCRNVLASHPLDAGVKPEFTVDADGSRLEAIARESVEAVLEATEGGERKALISLIGEGIEARQIVEALIVLRDRGVTAAELRQEPYSRRRVDALVERLRVAAAHVDELWHSGRNVRAITGNGPRTLAAVRRAAEFTPPEDSQPDQVIDALRRLAESDWPPALKNKLAAWSRGKPTKGEESHLGAGRETEIRETAAALRSVIELLPQLQPGRLRKLRRVLARAMSEIDQRMRARSVLSFSDLLSRTKALLDDRPAVRRRVRSGIDQLLVDEFQDTDAVQCEIFRRIALEGKADRRPGLFLVGDPKQSIYAWRNADLSAYQAFLDDCLAAGGSIERLSSNFRSSSEILDEVERTVASSFVEEAGLQPPFAPLVAVRGPRPVAESWRDRRPSELWVSWAADDGVPSVRSTFEAAAALEATALVDDLLDLRRTTGLRWGEVGVLFRSTHQLETYLRALRAAAIPFVVTRDKQYYQRREIIEAAALVRSILRPNDHLAALTYLRSAAVGLPDAALLPLWQRGLPGLLSDIGPDAPQAIEAAVEAVREVARELGGASPGLDRIPDWPATVEYGLRCLSRLRQALRSEPAELFVERLRRTTLIELAEAGRFLGRFRVANLERFFLGVAEALADPDRSLQSVVRSLERSVTRALEAEEALPSEGLEDAVRVGTIHGAKGLEFRHVYLVQMHAGTRRGLGDPTQTERCEGQLEYSVLGLPTPGFDLLERQRKRIDAAERVRLLYVAMTRAAERLVLVGKLPRQMKNRAPESARTLADLLGNRLPAPTAISELCDQARAAGRSWIDAAETRWRFPALDELTPGRTATRPRSLDAAALESAATTGWRRRRRLLESSVERMARPLGDTASALVDDPEGSDDTARAAAERRIALAVGSATHRVLETWNPGTDPDRELERQLLAVATRLGDVGDPDGDTVAQATGEIVRAFVRGPLFERWLALAPRTIGREIPIVLPAGVASGSRGIGYLTGSIDLVYRQEDGRLVIADYKTDGLTDAAAIAERAAHYAPQLSAYRAAVRAAFPEEPEPRTELWFLPAARIVPVG